MTTRLFWVPDFVHVLEVGVRPTWAGSAIPSPRSTRNRAASARSSELGEPNAASVPPRRRVDLIRYPKGSNGSALKRVNSVFCTVGKVLRRVRAVFLAS